jgi:very-short-patch-repair endonuclease
MRRLFTTADAASVDVTMHALKWGIEAGWWVRIVRGVYGEGPEPPTALDRERAIVLARATVARGGLGGVLLGLDSVRLDGRPTRARMVPVAHVAHGIPCADGLQTLIDLAAVLDDDHWEQALESALRKRLVTIATLEATVPALSASRTPGTARIRRVLDRRPPGAAPTESLLETLMVQLARRVPGLGEPVRQLRVVRVDGTFVARVDLCWPHLGIFLELDGQGHGGQPVYDAHRQTAVVAATGWLVARFTWWEVTRSPRLCVRRLTELVARRAA